MRPTQRQLVIISSIYRPDPAAVGQYLADVAEEMVRRGWRVVVYTANRGYDNPNDHYTPREVVDGVEVVRLPFSSFGKASIAVRLVGGLSFIAQATLRAVFSRRVDRLVISTTPPVSPLAGIVLNALRRIPVVYWIMDLNPDQFVALGHAKASALVVRGFDWMNRRILAAAACTVVLDRFMANRVINKLDVGDRLRIIPPWARDDHLTEVAHGDNLFRARHRLQGKFVVMYSGNHSPANPLATLIEAARQLRYDHHIVFVFIGGGVGKIAVDVAAKECENILSLPYQPPAELSDSLSAADVHVVTMGEKVVGIVHPSKIYGAFAVRRPVVFIGPRESHIGDMLGSSTVGWCIAHGDVDSLVLRLWGLAGGGGPDLTAMGERAKQLADARFGQRLLCAQFCDIVESPPSGERHTS